MYAIVDVETTGSYAAGNGITEIAICIHDGEKPIQWFESLVRPPRNIPMYITGLTGISNDMVMDAPSFEELIPEIERLTKGCIFVAHHVHFDYTFVRNEFERFGKSFNRNKLCTVRLSRKLIPGLPSYSLGRLCNQLGIQHENAHRAMGDLKATVLLFEKLLGLDRNNYIQSASKRNSGEVILPAHLPREQFDSLPEEPGVYYFKDGQGKIIYIGKAANLKQRVRQHFSGTDSSQRSEAFKRHIYEVRYKKTGSELVALLLEDSEIRRFWPRFNKAQKNPTRRYGIYQYEDISGIYRLGVNQAPSANGALQTFVRLQDARNTLGQMADTFGLCPALCGMGSFCERCNVKGKKCRSENVSAYNKRVRQAMGALHSESRRCALIGQGREEDEQSLVLVDGDKYLGFGFIQDQVESKSFEELSEVIERHPESPTVRNIIHKVLLNPEPLKVVYL